MLRNWIPRSIVALTLVGVMASGSALAQRGEKGGRDGGGGSDRGGESSARSSSRGGGEGSSKQSSSRGGGEGSSSRSFSRGSSRSESRGGESSQRSLSRSSDQSDRSGRESSRTGRSDERSADGMTRRGLSDQRSDDQRSQLQGRREYQARRPSDDQARRPSEDQVRDFLDIRGDDDRGRQRDDDSRLQDRDRDEFRGRFGDSRDRDRDRGDYRERDRGEFSRDRGDFRRDRDGDYDRWRRGELSDRGHDHRDWSGRWRDGDRFQTSHYIRDRWFRDRWDDRNAYPFYGGWWGRQRGGWDFWDRYAHRHNRPSYWWTWAAAPRLSSWVTYGWPQHYYWDYGRGEYIYYNDGAIYVNGRWYQPAQVFYDRTVELVDESPGLSAEEAAEKEWLPLGVFAVTREGSQDPNVLVQLAVTDDGVIGGTAFIPGSERSYPIEGVVEKETQRAVWSYTNERDQRVLMETSIFNLTQPEATGLVQYGPDQMRVIQLVRLEQPEGGPQLPATASEGELPTPSVR